MLLHPAAVALLLAATPLAAGVAPAGPLSDARLMQITLPTRNLSRSVAFYEGVLGLRLLFTAGNAAFLDAGGVRLRLEQSETRAPTGAIELYFNDPGLVHAEPLRVRGVRFLGSPEIVQHLEKADLQLLEFTDPDGNALALMGDVPRPR